MSLYAFSQSLYKSVGDKVAAEAVIATIGQSGGQPAAGLYFGIRKKANRLIQKNGVAKSARKNSKPTIRIHRQLAQ